MSTEVKGERIAKVIARAGYCSRRAAEILISQGKVKVNGKILETPATLVSHEDSIVIDGIPLRTAEKTRLWKFHKPRGYLVTTKDPQGRPTIFDILPPAMGNLKTVGRLDMMSEGLILLTNDGELSRYLEHPNSDLDRVYHVRILGTLTQPQIDLMKRGLTIEGVHYRPIKAKVLKQSGINAWLEIILSEGKNREIRKVMAHFDFKVNRLKRLSYGDIELGNLPLSAIEEIGIPAAFIKKVSL